MSQTPAHESESIDSIGLGSPRPTYRILEPFADTAPSGLLEDIKQRLTTALGHFPALASKTVNVGVLWENTDARARAFGYNRLIEIPTDRYTTNVTLYHELGHLAIRARNEHGEDHPETSEEYCSIYSVARMPPTEIDEDRIPYLGDPGVPKPRWPAICQDALEYRETHHAYIKQCRDWLEITQ